MSDIDRHIPFWRLAWRNTRRNKRRTFLTALAVAVAVAALTYSQSHIDGILGNLLETYAKTESGHVRIRRAGYSERERAMPVHLSMRNVQEVRSIVEEHDDVVAALPRIRAAVLVDGVESNRPGLVLGVDLVGEEGYLSPSAMILEGRLPRPGYPEMMLGKGFAERMEVSLGDTLTLLTQTAYRSLGAIRLRISGIGSTGMPGLDNRLMLVSIDQAQLLVDLEDGATEIVVFATSSDVADALAQDLAVEVRDLVPGGAEVISWSDQGPLVALMTTMKPMMAIIFVLLLLMASLIIVNTMLMTVMERTREFGMLAALGMRQLDIAQLILLEGLAIGIVGALAGGAVGSAVTIWVQNVGIDITAAMGDTEFPMKGVIYPHWTLPYSLIAAGVGSITAVISSIYPAWRAVRKTPAAAMHD